ncbi:GNAT family N-acetyltransferase [Kribbella sp. NPDC051770]|uniref:GNAT family N-acetyltransferase n=1 Tax=Kribbella sp. NPDC051770 TaxID=3155413 RepID=UPI00343CCD7F
MTVDEFLTVRPAVAADREPVAQMLAGMSDLTLYHRFQTPIRRPPRPAFVQHLVCPDGDAWVAARGDQVVGHAMWAWVRDVARPTAELAVIVAEGEQQRGLGARLLRAATERAVAAGATQFLLIVGAGNDAVLRTVRRHWPAASAQWNGSLVNFTIPA